MGILLVIVIFAICACAGFASINKENEDRKLKRREVEVRLLDAHERRDSRIAKDLADATAKLQAQKAQIDALSAAIRVQQKLDAEEKQEKIPAENIPFTTVDMSQFGASSDPELDEIMRMQAALNPIEDTIAHLEEEDHRYVD
jgi:hypothetical protein